MKKIVSQTLQTKNLIDKIKQKIDCEIISERAILIKKNNLYG